MDLPRNAKNDDGKQAASSANQVQGAAVKDATQDPAVDVNVQGPSEAQALPKQNDHSRCKKFLETMLKCPKKDCRIPNAKNPCLVIPLFKKHFEICRDCIAVEYIDHARICRGRVCNIAFCHAIRKRLSNFPHSDCLDMAIEVLQGRMLFESDRNDLKLFARELMRIVETDNDITTSPSDSDDESVSASKRIKKELEATDYWMHVKDCKDDTCYLSNIDSVCCERKKSALTLHNKYCESFCESCQLIEKFVKRHTEICQLKVCPIVSSRKSESNIQTDPTAPSNSSKDIN